jgi:hypothetical protein
VDQREQRTRVDLEHELLLASSSEGKHQPHGARGAAPIRQDRRSAPW